MKSNMSKKELIYLIKQELEKIHFPLHEGDMEVLEDNVDVCMQYQIPMKLIPEKVVKSWKNPSEVVLISKDGDVIRKTGKSLSFHQVELLKCIEEQLVQTYDEKLEELLYEGNDSQITTYFIKHEFVVMRIFYDLFQEECNAASTPVLEENEKQKKAFSDFQKMLYQEKDGNISFGTYGIDDLEYHLQEKTK